MPSSLPSLTVSSRAFDESILRRKNVVPTAPGNMCTWSSTNCGRGCHEASCSSGAPMPRPYAALPFSAGSNAVACQTASRAGTTSLAELTESLSLPIVC